MVGHTPLVVRLRHLRKLSFRICYFCLSFYSSLTYNISSLAYFVNTSYFVSTVLTFLFLLYLRCISFFLLKFRATSELWFAILPDFTPWYIRYLNLHFNKLLLQQILNMYSRGKNQAQRLLRNNSEVESGIMYI